MVILTPIIFLRVILKYHNRLEEDDIKAKYGSMYRGKNVEDIDHKAYLYPMLFFWRRLVFAFATVYLFSYPLMQMYVHLGLTMLTLILLMQNKRAFESQG